MKKLGYMATALAVVAPAFGAAQEQLSKEITVEREIVPEVRAASRLDLYPRQIAFPHESRSLDISDRSVRGEINPGIAMLEPAATEAAAPPTPYRGYLDAGYFPAANASLSAGYAIVSDAATRLGAWTEPQQPQLQGRSGSRTGKRDLQAVRRKGRCGFQPCFQREQQACGEHSAGLLIVPPAMVGDCPQRERRA